MTVHNFHCSQWHQAVTLCFALRAPRLYTEGWMKLYTCLYTQACLVPGLHYKRSAKPSSLLWLIHTSLSLLSFSTACGARLGTAYGCSCSRRSEELVLCMAGGKAAGDHRLQRSVAARATYSPSLRWAPEPALGIGASELLQKIAFRWKDNWKMLGVSRKTDCLVCPSCTQKKRDWIHNCK